MAVRLTKVYCCLDILLILLTDPLLMPNKVKCFPTIVLVKKSKIAAFDVLGSGKTECVRAVDVLTVLREKVAFVSGKKHAACLFSLFWSPSGFI